MSLPNLGSRIEKAVWKVLELGRGVLPLPDLHQLVASVLVLKLMVGIAEDRESGVDGEGPPLWRRVKLPSDLRWGGDLYSLSFHVGDVFRQLERLNEGLFCDVFDALGIYRLLDLQEGRRLFLLALEVMQFLELRPSRVGDPSILGEAYESFSVELMNGGYGGSFPIPEAVVSLMVQAMNPRGREAVYDPSCGLGQLLSRSFKYAGRVSLTGQSRFSLEWGMCKLNMLFHGIGAAEIEVVDVLRRPAMGPNEELPKYDVILSNPPFGVGNWGVDEARYDRRFWRGIPPANVADYAFLSHIVESLREGGRAAVIVSPGVLSRGGSEAEIRKKFVQENLIDTVLALPAGLFSATRIPVAVIVFSKGRESREILFVDSTQEFTPGKGRNILSGQTVEKLVVLYRSRETVPGFSRLVGPGEVEGNNFNLSVSRYVGQSQDQSVDLAVMLSDVQVLESELAAVRSEIDRYIGGLGINSATEFDS